MGLDPEKMNYGIGLAATQAGGLKQVFGTMAKPFHAGKAAMDGLLAALLAEKGFTCSDDILTGDMGFCQVLSPEMNPEMITDDFGKSFAIRNVIFKRHASCFETHPTIDAALALLGEVNPGDVEEILVEAGPVALEIAGKPEPCTGLEGKFSLAYCVALAVCDGNTGEQDFTDTKVTSEPLASLLRKVKVQANEDLGITRSEIRVRMKDGRELRSSGDTLEASADKDKRKSDLIRKFRSFADRLLPAGNADSILEIINNLENEDNLTRLIGLCCTR
jgi:2-methylcitrate dehydratase PrpD